MTRTKVTSHAGAVKPDERPGALAGGDLLDAPGLFQRLTNWITRPKTHRGARGPATTHDTPRAPELVIDNTKTFHCPEWPKCACPRGTMRADCPGLTDPRNL